MTLEQFENINNVLSKMEYNNGLFLLQSRNPDKKALVNFGFITGFIKCLTLLDIDVKKREDGSYSISPKEVNEG